MINNQEIQLFDGTYEQYKNYTPKVAHDTKEDLILLLETKLTEVLSRLSIEPSDELEVEFQRLLAEKRKLNNQ